MNAISRKERILGGLWGAVTGDALGVPVEFEDRLEVRSHPVVGIRGHGTHDQPAGTWSDDSSLLLCTADSLLRYEFDIQAIPDEWVRQLARQQDLNCLVRRFADLILQT